MKKKMMIYAYTNFNLGDDLFIKLLIDRYPETNFYLYAHNGYKRLFKDSKNIKVYAYNNPLYRGINFMFRILGINKLICRAMIANKCDGAVYIGGSLFMQNEIWKEHFENVKHMRIPNKPFFLLGANFGPYHDRNFYHDYYKLFKGYTDICFRDRSSYELFKNLPNVRMADDIIFQLKKEPKTKKIKNNNIAISVIKPSRKNLENLDDIYFRKIKDIIILFNTKGYHVSLMSFCKNQGDKEAMEEILKLLPKENLSMVTCHSYEFNIRETIRVIENAAFVVATRFHAMILGWLYNKPVFPIAYSEKMTNVMTDIGFNREYTDFDHIGTLEAEDVFNSMLTNQIDVSKQIENSKGHFKVLDQFLIERV